ncbi:glycosyltransferase family 2 protein [Weissella paramesenteroides]|uniref:glycosyltransferase family 2 protein n=1 Tax=Weissella paramesenteroides TaxID=1249 RepID=UPI003F1F0EAF
MKNRVSIIIPIFNVVEYVQQSVWSILNQTYKNLEVILVDDGSTDGSSELADSIAVKDSRVKVIHQKNSGLSAARNIGFAQASGEYVYFFDSDDLVEPKLIEDAVCFLESHSADFVSFTHDFIDERGNYFHKNLDNTEYASSNIFTNDELISKLLVGKVRISAWSYIFRRENFKNYNILFQVGKKYEDNDTTIKAILASRKSGILGTLQKPYYHYRQRRNSITGNLDISNFKDLISVTESVKKIVQNNNKISNELNIYCLNQYFSAYKILREVGGKKEEFLMIDKLIHECLSVKAIMINRKMVVKYCYWKIFSCLN